MAASNDTPSSPKEEVDQLRARVDALSGPAVPLVAAVTDQAKVYAQQAQDAVGDQTEWLSQRARQSPFTAVAIACGVGYLLGRIVR